MNSVALGAKDEDTLTSLANRIIRLNAQLEKPEKPAFKEKVGVSADKLSQQLLDAFDEDIITEKAKILCDTEKPNEEQLKQNLGALGWNLTAAQIEILDNASRRTPTYPYWHQADFSERNPLPV